MLDLLNRYAHGYVAVPVAAAFAARGGFARLRDEPAGAQALAEALEGNPGHLAVALRLLQSMGWLSRDAEGRFAPTPAAQPEAVPEGLVESYDFDWAAWLQTADSPAEPLARWLPAVEARWEPAAPWFADFLDGVLLLPLLAGLGRAGLLQEAEAAAGFPSLPPGPREALAELFRLRGWRDGKGLTDAGRFLVERGGITGTTASYGPMLRRLPELLFGDCAAVFGADAFGHERHLDRALNVVASGFQHQKYFADLEEAVLAVFDREPLERQPRAIVDMGCGDGSLLLRLWQAVRERSLRGRHLDSHPLTLVGADFNARALEESTRTLAGTPHRLLAGDIADPQRLLRDLAALGFDDPDALLHVRSFLDHDRPWRPPEGPYAPAGEADEGVYVDRDGSLLDPAAVRRSLVEHLARWADCLGRHGLLLLEVHGLNAETVRRHRDETECLHFDAYHAFSGQQLVPAQDFLLAAAEAGLIGERGALRRYPRVFPLTRIALHRFERRPWRIRPARPEDLPALLRLETACWPAELRSPEAVLRRRLQEGGGAHCVLEDESGVVAAAYTQRIAGLEVLRQARWQALDALRQDDGPLLQLLGVNVLPEAQDRGLGDRFLEFLLQWAELTPGVEGVAGVTRCRERPPAGVDYAAYVGARDAEGLPLDPILRFHARHGAAMLGPLPGYRPEDAVNEGHGVLLAYDLAAEPDDEPQAEAPAVEDLAGTVDACIRRVMRPGRREAYDRRAALRDLGLDSADLLELRVLLSRRLGIAIEPSFFFSHGSGERIAAALAGATPAQPAQRPAASARVTLPEPTPEANPAPAADREAIAVVGLACRFPGGADDPESFWALLSEGRDAVTAPPAARGPRELNADPGVARGGFLDGIEGFDADCFGIAPREARLMDPQQRLLLEAAQEALERAGLDSERLRGSRTGVFLGLFAQDYESRLLAAGAAEPDIHLATGTSGAVAAGRLAYHFGFEGPALTVNTACSSSLVAVHLACRSLLDGESELALAGGVNLLLSPHLSRVFAQAGMLSPSGLCRSFDAAADGYVRSEGCGLVLLKRLSRAQAEGDRILAVIRGSAVNQDGASNGLTAPSGPAQRRLIEQTLAGAGVAPAEVGLLEAHGTGTVLGDPVEVEALGAVYGRGRPADRPLRLGSVKSSIGHAEAAAGVAGLIKAVLALRHRQIPPHLHLRRVNPQIDLAAIPAEIPDRLLPWEPPPGGRRLAAVSSFGFSGTNAHLVLEEAPGATAAQGEATGPCPSPALLPISAETAPALRALAGRWADWMEAHPEAAPAEIALAAAVGRRHRPLRAALPAGDRGTLLQGLRALAEGRDEPARAERPPRVAFLFTGQGSQFPGMGRALYDSEPVFRETLERCAELLDPVLERPLTALLFGEDAEALRRTANAQPALFALQVASAALWRARGLEPALVLGHSVGEIAAAQVAGVLSLEEAATLVAARGRLMQALPAGGAMVAVLAAESVVAEAVAPYAERVAVAAINAPRNVVVSGEAEAVETALAPLREAGVRCVALTVSHAFHSPAMEPMLAPFAEALAGLHFAAPKLPFLSSVTAAPIGEAVAAPDYWVRQVRAPVRFAAAAAALPGLGVEACLEIGPQPVLTPLARASLPDAALAWLGCPAAPGEAMTEALAELYRLGAPLDWPALHGGRQGPRLELPPYPFQRRRHWVDLPSEPAARPAAQSAAQSAAVAEHPLLGRRLPLAGSSERRWEARFTAASTRFFEDHRLFGRIIVPAASHVAMMAETLAEQGAGPGAGPAALAELHFPEPLLLPDEGARTAQLVQAGEALRLYTTPEGVDDWRLHAQGRVVAAEAAAAGEAPVVIAARLPEPRSGETFYAAFRAAGYTFGPALCWIDEIRQGEGEALCRLVRPQGLDDREAAYGVYPALLDAAFQLQGVWFGAEELAGAERLFVPFAIDRLTFHAPCRPGEALWSHAVRRAGDEDGASVVADLRLLDENGAVRVEARGFRFRLVERAGLLAALDASTDDDLWHLDWQEAPLPAPASLPEPAALAAGLTEARAEAERRLAPLAAPALLPAAEAWCAGRIAEVLAEAGVEGLAGTPSEVEAAAAQVGVAPRHRRLFERLLAMPAKTGAAATPAALDALAAAHPAAAAELALLRRCGSALGPVLRGETDPLSLLFPEGDAGPLTALYRDAPGFAAVNALTAEAAARLLEALPPGRRLRVLEVGAGTGATTAALLERLPAARCDYLFTDLSARFTAAAAERFAGWGPLRTAVLDLERPAAEQGLGEARFDLILAANVLHATRELKASLENLRELLAPGGLLLLQETTAPRAWVELTFGLTEGWWRFADRERRPDQPLLPPEAWAELLRESGFEAVETLRPTADALLFEQSLLLAREPEAAETKRWLLLGGGGFAETLASRLGAAERLPADAAGLEALAGPWTGVVHLGGLEDGEPAGEALAALQRLARRGEPAGPLWLVTRGAQAAEGEALPAPEAAALWGLARAARLEHPELGLRLLDLDPAAEDPAGNLASALRAPDAEEEALLRGGRRLVPRLRPLAPPSATPFAPAPERFCLLTGGLGSLGLRLARALVARGARRLLLAGRTAPGPEAQAAIEALRAAGAEVLVRRADLADPAQAAALVAEAAPLGSVFHLAGRLDDGALLGLDRARLEAVMAPKAGGALALHAATRDLDLQAFVLFSSVGGLLGNAGQANHAAANALLDALARHRRGLGLPALAVDWGAWAEVGSVAAHNPFLGLRPMPPERCLERLFALLGAGESQTMVAAVDWPLLLGRRRPARMLTEVARAVAPAAAPASPAPRANLAETLRSLPPAERRARLAAAAAETLAGVLGLPAGAAIDPRRGFFKLGLDSLTSVELRNRLQAELGVPLPATLAFDHPDIESLTDQLLARLFEAESPPGDDLAELSTEELSALIDAELEALGFEEAAP